MKKTVFTLFIVLFFGINAFSQSITITVKDEQTRQPIPFVNALHQNSQKGWSSNVKGIITLNYSDFSSSDSLVFSSVGYKKKTLSIGEITRKNTVFLVTNDIRLKEVNISEQKLKKARLGSKKVSKGILFYKHNHLKINADSREAKFIPNDIGADGIIDEIKIYVQKGSNYPYEVDLLMADELTGFPTESLLSEPLKITSIEDDYWETIELKKHRISIPQSGFFVSINKYVDSAPEAPINYETYQRRYKGEKNTILDTVFYRATVIGPSFDQENTWWITYKGEWKKYWDGLVYYDLMDTMIEVKRSYNPDEVYSHKSTLAIYATIIYSKSKKKYAERSLQNEGIVSERHQKKILKQKYKYVREDLVLYKQNDVFQLFNSVKVALEANDLNYIAHHLLCFNYESIMEFDLEMNQKTKGQIMNEMEEILENREEAVLKKESNGFYSFEYKGEFMGRLLNQNGKWRLMME